MPRWLQRLNSSCSPEPGIPRWLQRPDCGGSHEHGKVGECRAGSRGRLNTGPVGEGEAPRCEIEESNG